MRIVVPDVTVTFVFFIIYKKYIPKIKFRMTLKLVSAYLEPECPIEYYK